MLCHAMPCQNKKNYQDLKLDSSIEPISILRGPLLRNEFPTSNNTTKVSPKNAARPSPVEISQTSNQSPPPKKDNTAITTSKSHCLQLILKYLG